MSCNGEAMSGRKDFHRLLEQVVDDEGGNAPAARRLGVTPSTLWKWRTQDRQPSVEHCTQIAAALGMHPLEVVSMVYNLPVPTIEDVIEWDRRLDPGRKEHLRRQINYLTEGRGNDLPRPRSGPPG